MQTRLVPKKKVGGKPFFNPSPSFPSHPKKKNRRKVVVKTKRGGEGREKKIVSEVGFEPTPIYMDQMARTRNSEQGFDLESGALDHSATLTSYDKVHTCAA